MSKEKAIVHINNVSKIIGLKKNKAESRYNNSYSK